MANTVETKINAFFSQFPLRRYPKGQLLIYSGESSDMVFYLLSGKVKQYDISYRGEEVIVNIFKDNAFFPLSMAINETVNPYFFEAESDIQLRAAASGQVIDFIKQNPDVMFDLLSRIYKGVDGILGRMAHLMSSNANSRLIYELVLETKRFGNQYKDKSYSIAINEKDLAARTGLTRETINREIRKLKFEKLLVIRKKDIHILDLDKLETKLQKASMIV
jgi:CRP/FNR family cyclic AMP-dependent transcriptional regulator